MVLLREQVKCFRCERMVHKTDTRLVKTMEQLPQLECFDCFRRSSTPAWKKIVQLREKCELYCEKCRYKFYSSKLVCPYCNQGDNLCKGDVSIHDLI